MSRIILAAFLSLLAIHSASARLFGIHSYDELAKASDCVIIVSVSAPTEHTGKKQRYWNQAVEQVRTRFGVQAVLKGKYDSASWSLDHLVHTPDPVKTVSIDEMPFVEFTKANESYLVFLKQSPDGSLVPLTGTDDPESFVKLPLDRPAAVNKELGFDWSTGQLNIK